MYPHVRIIMLVIALVAALAWWGISARGPEAAPTRDAIDIMFDSCNTYHGGTATAWVENVHYQVWTVVECNDGTVLQGPKS